MRSALFAGATRPDLVAKTARSGPDAVVIDLEDAVPAAAKDEARAALPELVAAVEGPRVFVRVNGPATAWFEPDLAALAALPVAGVVVAEVESTADLERVWDVHGEGIEVVAGLESARGVAAAEEILAASPAGAYFGAEDYVADLGGRRTHGGEEVLFARSKVALAARLAGVPVLDQVVVDFRDEALFERDAEAGRALGYRGKLCIHPSQVPIANRVFGASPEEVERARALLAAWEEGAARGVAAVEFDGAMVDGPALRMARDTIERGRGVMFDLDEDHLAFREVCRNFVANEVKPHVREAEASGTFPPELWPKLADAGLLGLGHPEELGGSGGGVLALTILSEQLAHSSGGLAVTPLVSSYMAGPHLARYGDDEQKERWLRPLLAGECVAAIAVTEPGAGSDVAAISTRARVVDGGYLLNGTKMFITNAGFADLIIVAAKTDPEAGHRGITTFLVERGAEGMSLSAPLEKLGWHASDTREIVFDDCFVAAGSVLGEAARGFHQIMEAFQVERISLAAMGVGLAQAALDEAVAHAKERRTFGVALSKHQTISHRLAAAGAELEAARTLTYQAAARWDSGHPEAASTTAMAKLVAPRVASRVVDEALQVFGGYGFIEETPVAMHYRDARILRIGGGTDEVQLEILAKRMGL